MKHMKTAVVAAGALAAATFTPAAPASAGNLEIAGIAAVIAAFALATHDSAPAPRAYAAPPHWNQAPAHVGPPRWNRAHARGHGSARAHAWAPHGPARGRPRAHPGRAPYAYAPPRPRWQPRCMERNEIRHMLARQGWHDFGVDRFSGDIAVVYSSRDGVRYRIKLDRCTGQFIKVSQKGLF